jgi:hypothetical protein
MIMQKFKKNRKSGKIKICLKQTFHKVQHLVLEKTIHTHLWLKLTIQMFDGYLHYTG